MWKSVLFRPNAHFLFHFDTCGMCFLSTQTAIAEKWDKEKMIHTGIYLRSWWRTRFLFLRSGNPNHSNPVSSNRVIKWEWHSCFMRLGICFIHQSIQIHVLKEITKKFCHTVMRVFDSPNGKVGQCGADERHTTERPSLFQNESPSLSQWV